ncbi:MAG TPA: CDP-diacylglycerol--glycerol-3-phosphate 3-phosphatidyltransferase [Spirochaetota bacterium]|nr:CDP-diacylglycerol--glycerol-3-phosphate 3-phosphatidyltransferase [Spirochaetota bacterium]HOM37737.1 CDP-diacylglycerol--glycerol-3-phosphate 3-phosphatidyltransferase [Spirochaetota bacterium]HPQ49695.1 CDP-diacylglycerol--glycerol-3-phosphate 3-phosphatidyltransferase [Spirochaetota bacterium]
MIKNLPNILTVFRIILIIPVIVLLRGNYVNKIISFILFLIAGITDYIDGKIARKYNMLTSFGNFLDPLADKLLVISLLISFLSIDPSIFPYWMVWIIIVREFVITLLRIEGISKNSEVKTLFIGKLKTGFQFFTISIIIIFLILKDYLIEKKTIRAVEGLTDIRLDDALFYYFGDISYFIAYTPSVFLCIVVIFSLYSGIKYIVKNKHIIFYKDE